MKMYALIRWTLPLLFAALWMGCGSSVEVTTDHDPNTDFSQFKTYQWLSRDDGNIYETGLLAQHMVRTIDREMEMRGFNQTTSNPDLLLTYHAGVQEKVTGATVNDMGWGYGWGWYGGMGTTTVDYNSYNEATLLVDIIDAAQKQLVWRGMAQGAASENPDPDKSRERLDKVIMEMMASFPPISAP